MDIRLLKIIGAAGGLGLFARILGSPIAGIVGLVLGGILACQRFPKGEKPWSDIAGLLTTGENQRAEFKAGLSNSEKNGSPYEGIIRAVIGFSNADGGEVLVGVDDSGNPVGFDSDLALFKTKDQLLSALNNSIRTGLKTPSYVNYRTKWERVVNSDILRIEVEKSCKDVFDSKGRYFLRKGNQTLLYSTQETIEHKAAKETVI